MKDMDKMNDSVNHPHYYTYGNIETIDYIKDKGWSQGFCLGNAIKYITRAGVKDENKTIEDLQKAIWYINSYIEYLSTSSDDKGKIE